MEPYTPLTFLEAELELNLHEAKYGQSSTHKLLKNQYNEWLNGIKKEGTAIIKSVNPAMKNAYRHVRATGKQIKDKSKQAYRDLRSILQSNNSTLHLPSASNNHHHHHHINRPRSAPSSPVASPTSSRKSSFKSPVFKVSAGINSTGVKKSMSGVIVQKTSRTATYVREKQPPSATEVNGSSLLLSASSSSTSMLKLTNSRSSENLTSLMHSES